MSNFELTKNDTLIINGVPITEFSEGDVDFELKIGKNTNHYCLDIEVEQDSEADLQLKKLLRGKK